MSTTPRRQQATTGIQAYVLRAELEDEMDAQDTPVWQSFAGILKEVGTKLAALDLSLTTVTECSGCVHPQTYIVSNGRNVKIVKRYL